VLYYRRLVIYDHILAICSVNEASSRFGSFLIFSHGFRSMVRKARCESGQYDMCGWRCLQASDDM